MLPKEEKKKAKSNDSSFDFILFLIVSTGGMILLGILFWIVVFAVGFNL